jgi:ABC-type nitrate/sulfonate/bicarbonate transport system permease component
MFKKITLITVHSGLLAWATLLGVWWLLAHFNSADFLPGPVETLKGALELQSDGSLLKYIGISAWRVLSGWTLGCLVAIPLGILMGRVQVIRALTEPLLNFVRFIPPIAFVTLFLLWFGMGETAKVMLILYATIFTVLLNTMTGVIAIPEDRLRSARIMGASEWQLLRFVVLPSAVPHIFTGVRLAMGASFMAIIGAEMVAANEGVGFMIWNARLYFKTDWIFVGLIVLGLMGFITDRLLAVAGRRFLANYGIVTGAGWRQR